MYWGFLCLLLLLTTLAHHQMVFSISLHSHSIPSLSDAFLVAALPLSLSLSALTVCYPSQETDTLYYKSQPPSEFNLPSWQIKMYQFVNKWEISASVTPRDFLIHCLTESPLQFVVRTLKTYSCSTFQMHRAVWLAAGTSSVVHLQGFLVLCNWSSVLDSQLRVSPSASASSTFLDSKYEWNHAVVVFLLLTYVP